MTQVLPWLAAVNVGSSLVSDLLGNRDIKRFNKQQRIAQERANLINALGQGRFNFRAPQQEFSRSGLSGLASGIARVSGLGMQAAQLHQGLTTQRLQQENLQGQLDQRAADVARQRGADQSGGIFAGLRNTVAADPMFGEGSDARLLQNTVAGHRFVPEPGDLEGRNLDAFTAGFRSDVDRRRQLISNLAIDEGTRADTASQVKRQLSRQDTLDREATRRNRIADWQAEAMTRSTLDWRRHSMEQDELRTRAAQTGVQLDNLKLRQEMKAQTDAELEIANFTNSVINGMSIREIPDTEVRTRVLGQLAVLRPDLMQKATETEMTPAQIESFSNMATMRESLGKLLFAARRGQVLDEGGTVTPGVEIDNVRQLSTTVGKSGIFDPEVYEGWTQSLPRLFGVGAHSTDDPVSIDRITTRNAIQSGVKSVQSAIARMQGNIGNLSDVDIANIEVQLPDVDATYAAPEVNKLEMLVDNMDAKFDAYYASLRSQNIAVPTTGNPDLDARLEKQYQSVERILEENIGSGASAPVPVYDPRRDAERSNQIDPLMGTSLSDRQRARGFLGTQADDPSTTGIISGLGNRQQAPQIDSLYNAIVSQESSNDYTAINPDSGAIGLGQVLKSNIPDWSMQILGRKITPKQFAADPQIQETIIRGMLERFYTEELQHANGDPNEAIRRVAAKWYSGRGHLFNDTRPQGDGRYPSIYDYSNSILNRVLGGYR